MNKRSSTKASASTDGPYLLKLVLYLLVGSLWVKLNFSATQIGLPLGLAIGLVVAARDKSRADRKIIYAVLIVSMLVGYFAPYGLYIAV